MLPLLLAGSLFLFVLRPAAGPPGDQLLNFGKAGARIAPLGGSAVRFTDVAGVDEAKQELQEIVEFLAQPMRFAALGARLPRGVVLVGPPGTGKTLLARAVAGEAWVPFFSISASEFVEIFVGVGASRVRDLFERARRHAPCIVFVDEIDAVGRSRGLGFGSGNDEREQTLNQILVEMDGFNADTNVIVIAATNRPDVLDPALLRPGRFDRQVFVPAPDMPGRKAILEVHARGKPFDASVDLNVLARVTPGFSGADLANLVNEGAILAARRNQKSISMSALAEAIDRVIAGPAYKSRALSERDKALAAYHESGHAVVMHQLAPGAPAHKISIVLRGGQGRHCSQLLPEDTLYATRSQVQAALASALGGRAAEQLVFGETSTAAETDIQKATDSARKMIQEYGMSDRLGKVALKPAPTPSLFGRHTSEPLSYSDKTAQAVDEEVRRLLDEAFAQATAVIAEHRDILAQLATELVQCETLEGADLERIFTPA